jgi:1-pyrroline-5-carboxylate dehydrogenase
MFIGGKEVRTGDKTEIHPPHEHHHVLGHYHRGNVSHVKQAITAAMRAKKNWEALSWENRATFF